MITSCINLELFAFPASLLLGVLYLLAIWLLVHYYRESKTFKFFRSIWVAVSLTALVALFVAIDGVMGYALQHS